MVVFIRLGRDARTPVIARPATTDNKTQSTLDSRNLTREHIRPDSAKQYTFRPTGQRPYTLPGT